MYNYLRKLTRFPKRTCIKSSLIFPIRFISLACYKFCKYKSSCHMLVYFYIKNYKWCDQCHYHYIKEFLIYFISFPDRWYIKKWVSECCSTPSEQFSSLYHDKKWLHVLLDDDICSVLHQQFELYFDSASSLKQQPRTDTLIHMDALSWLEIFYTIKEERCRKLLYINCCRTTTF